ncbi:MAG: glucose-6-phosphate isomerase [Phycisphaerae bacterium]|nr:glucose-6-phosphate isomerase [Phycisphaerae bacterium]MBM91145.1 glucose-6-phosphate isomerase [Phycisphaerae bacterium]HCT45285.1 glucose-6-phosphate isomerase [Phycisphaerales bacterium]
MLTIDYANCLTSRVGAHGLADDTISTNADRLSELTRSLNQSRGTGWERWRELWNNPMRQIHLDQVQAVANESEGRFENLVVLGIGGSALGNIAIQSALNSPVYNLLPHSQRPGPRVFVVDNVDPANLNAVLSVCDPRETLFNVVSKSGETAETASQFMIIRKILQDSVGSRWADHVVAITDPEKGTMRTICDKAGITTLPVPEGVGGRFSVLSPVGLFSAAMAGIDIEALLDGAKAMDERCSSEDATKNPAAILAHLLVHLGNGAADMQPKPNHVMMPYANGLKLMGDWYAQLWAESLGKKSDKDGNEVFAGYTPISALGTTDQHSQVQLYREGPNDKVIGFCEVEDFGDDQSLTIPTGMGVEAIEYLEGKRMVDLLNAEKRATEYALVDSQRPNYTIKFPKIDAHHIGEFIALWEIATAYAGLMLGIDAYDQPAVETGKKATFGLMGREGYSDWLSKVNDTLGETPHFV